MASVIDEKQYPVYTLDSDPEMEKKKNGTYSTEEILEAVNSTIKGEKFICGKIVSYLTAEKEIVPTNSFIKSLGCDGMSVTDREIDIIRGIAEGLSNKLIADKLKLSTHTVNTHRKNIMSKLGVNNTAGVVMFAVKNQ